MPEVSKHNKNLIKMKKNVFCVIALVIFSFVGSSKDNNFNKFFESKEFNQLSKTFSISLKDIDLDNYAFIAHESKKYNIYRVRVRNQITKNFITFFTDNNGESYGLAFEKIDVENAKAEHYDEYGNLYATFILKKISETLYDYKIDKVYSPDTDSNNITLKGTCVAHIYHQLKKACEADEDCDFLCDWNPGCHTMMMSWAVLYCVSH